MMCEQKVVILCSRDQQEQTRFCLVFPQYNTSASLRPGKGVWQPSKKAELRQREKRYSSLPRSATQFSSAHLPIVY